MSGNVYVVGIGYVGLATAVSFAHLGHHVVAVEINEQRLALLRDGRPPFLEGGMKEFLVEGIGSGRLQFVHPDEADYAEADFVFLCLPTPEGPDGGADLSALRAAIEAAAPKLRPGAVVVDKSTVPVGTTRSIATALNRSDVAVVSNPEFLQEGAAIEAFLQADRIVVGADDTEAAQRVADLYAAIPARVILTGIESAELAKHACNAFLATKLSFVNSIAALCDLTGADIAQVTEVMGSDTRIGPKFLQPGPGWGGSCFPKDTSSLITSAAQSGLELTLLRAVVESNRETFDRVVATLAELCGGRLHGRRIAVWGLTFKAGTDDVRDSPAIEIVNRLQAEGAIVLAYDPEATPVSHVSVASDPYEAAIGADALVVLTEWRMFAAYDLERVAEMMNSPSLLDTRGVIDPERARRAGFDYRAIGHPGGPVSPWMDATAPG